jgi:hypothetical protein
MSQDDKIDKLKESIQICDIHFFRMDYALTKVKSYFPLDYKKYHNLDFDDLTYLDQLIFRFSKLQDSMGSRLFPSLLENLGEDTEGKPFIDILTKMEKLNLIDNHKMWLKLRETRNIVTHEYPFFTPEIIDGLNLLTEQAQVLENIWQSLKQFTEKRFNLK